MIDDVTLVASLGDSWPHTLRGNVKLVPVPNPSGGTTEGQAVAGPGWYLRVCHANGDVSLKVSIPQLANGYKANFPLQPVSSWDPRVTAREVAYALGVDDIDTWTDSLAEGFLAGWGVRSVAFALDAHVRSTTDVCRAFRTLRTRQHRMQSWGHPPHGCQYETSLCRIQIYDKERALRGQIPRPAKSIKLQRRTVSPEQRAQLIAQAKGYLRLEVTYRGSKAVRHFAGLSGGCLPTLEWVSDPRVSAWALDHELRKLGVFQVSQSPGPHRDPVELLRFLGNMSSEYRSTRNDGSEGTKFGGAQLLAAAMLLLVSDRMDKQELRSAARLTTGSYYRLRRHLKAMGIHQCGNMPEADALADFAETVATELQGVLPDCLPHPTENQVVEAPWAARMGLDGAEVDDSFDDVLEVV